MKNLENGDAFDYLFYFLPKGPPSHLLLLMNCFYDFSLYTTFLLSAQLQFVYKSHFYCYQKGKAKGQKNPQRSFYYLISSSLTTSGYVSK